MGFSPQDLITMQRRLARKSGPVGGAPATGDGVDAGEEIEKLHRPAAAWLKARNIAFVWNRTDVPSTATEGAPDFVIACNPPLFVEFKTKVGKLSEKQRDWHFLAERQGVTVHVLRSFESFEDLMKDKVR